jgi:hypothetical protein
MVEGKALAKERRAMKKRSQFILIMILNVKRNVGKKNKLVGEGF